MNHGNARIPMPAAPARLFLLLLLLPTACSRADAALRRLTLTGSSTIAPLANEIGKRFAALHPGVQVDVQSGGSGRGISEARSGLNDIGLCSRALHTDERDLRAFPIARDGVCVILHRTNPVTALSDAQVAAIYRGQTSNWRDVGGSNAPITVVNKAEGRSTLELFCQFYRLTSTDIRAHVVIGDNEQGIKTVAGNPNAIGYVSIGTAEYDAGKGVPIKLLPVGGVAAAIATVRDGSFPLARPLNLLTRQEPTGLVREFLDFARSERVHDLIREQCFVPLPQ